MTAAISRTRRNRAKTWSSFGNLGRKPSEYEIVTHDMNHTFGGDSEPLEMGSNVHGNVWLREHRDARIFGVTDWNAFRDPDEMTYRKYCQLQDEQETYVDGLLKDFTEVKQSDAGLTDTALQFLQLVMTPCRYLGHGEQMLSAYLQQLAPSSYVANCATLQTADTLRRVQRVAYRTKQLEKAYPQHGFGSSERKTWEADTDWQSIRQAIETQMICYDFDKAFVGFQLVIKPIVDNLFLNQFARVARSHGADADAAIADNLYVDSLRSQNWTAAMTRFVHEQNAEGRDIMQRLLDEYSSLGQSVIDAGARLLARNATEATVELFAANENSGSSGKSGGGSEAVAKIIASRVRSDWATFLAEAGLGRDAADPASSARH